MPEKDEKKKKQIKCEAWLRQISGVNYLLFAVYDPNMDH